MISNEFKVGSRVDVIDLRDNAVVDTNAIIEAIIMEQGKAYANLSCGYAVSLACLRHHQPSIADALPRSLNHAINIAKESRSTSHRPGQASPETDVPGLSRN